MKQRGTGKKQEGAKKNKRVLAKTKGCSALLFWAGENAGVCFLRPNDLQGLFLYVFNKFDK